METKIEVREEGVAVITSDGEVVAIIYNDQKTKAKRLFNLVEMSIDEIVDLIKGNLYTAKIQTIVDEVK